MAPTSHAEFYDLENALTDGSILFPRSKAYKDAIFIGNQLYASETPSAVVQAVTEEDIRQTVLFAAKKNKSLSVKSGGHSYAGYCLNKNGIVLDLSAMNEVDIDDKHTMITMQGGAVWKDAYDYLKDKDESLMVIGGQCPTVGVSAFTLGAGLSPFSRGHGLGIDNLIEMTIITADGSKVTISEKDTESDKRDLFWAIRGGGGGNFGITTKIKAKLHKLVDPHGMVVCGDLTWNIPLQENDFKEMMKIWNTTHWPNEVCADAIWRYTETSQLQGQLTIIYNGNMDDCNKAIEPLLKFNPQNDLKPMHWADWERIDAAFDVFTQDVYFHHGSFILPDGAISEQVVQTILATMKKVDENRNGSPISACHILWDHIGGVTMERKPEETAFPWRKGMYVATIRAQWVDPTLEKKMVEWVDAAKTALLPHALDGQAAYINYIDSTVPDWQYAYYGNNYARLQKIKSRWDPSNFFKFKQSIEPAPAHRTDNQCGRR